MSGGDHGVSSEDRQHTAADPISTESSLPALWHMVSDPNDLIRLCGGGMKSRHELVKGRQKNAMPVHAFD